MAVWAFVGMLTTAALAEGIHNIVIDGNFSDWAAVPSRYDPVSGPGVLHDGIPDTHDTDHFEPGDVPGYVSHTNVDLVEFKFTHDSENLYAWFRATGQIGRTGSGAVRGRYYVIVTIDVDNDATTGYPIHEGGYYPTSSGYDMNMEVEYYDGAFNTGHYLNHGARSEAELDAAMRDQTNGIVRVLPGTYNYYSQWVWFDAPGAGAHRLPPPDNSASITFVHDRGPVYQGIIRIALSPDGHQAEMVAPFRGFMRSPSGNPIVALRKTINVSFSLEASGEMATGDWASDSGDPIIGYYLSPFPAPTLQLTQLGLGDIVLSWPNTAKGMLLQQASDLTSPNWQTVSGSDATNRVTMPIGSGNGFFRLSEP